MIEAKTKIGIKPLGDLIIVERVAAEKVTKLGIIIPVSAQESLDQGVVVATGAGKKRDDGTRIPMELELGDEVFFSKYAKEVVKINGKEYVSMHEADIFGISIPLE